MLMSVAGGGSTVDVNYSTTTLEPTKLTFGNETADGPAVFGLKTTVAKQCEIHLPSLKGLKLELPSNVKYLGVLWNLEGLNEELNVKKVCIAFCESTFFLY